MSDTEFNEAWLAAYKRNHPELFPGSVPAEPAKGDDTAEKPKRASKWHNVRTEMAGMTFQSGHEAAVIGNLMTAEEHRAGVFGLRLQVRFPLPGGKFYDADATYLDEHLKSHVIDAKGWNQKTQKYILTAEFRSKRRQFRELYGQEIELL